MNGLDTLREELSQIADVTSPKIKLKIVSLGSPQIPEGYRSELEALEAEGVKAQAISIEKEKEIAKLETSIASQEAIIEELEAQTTIMISGVEMTPEEKARISGLNNQIEELKVTVTQNEAAIPPLRSKINSLEKQIPPLQSRITNLEMEIPVWRERERITRAAWNSKRKIEYSERGRYGEYFGWVIPIGNIPEINRVWGKDTFPYYTGGRKGQILRGKGLYPIDADKISGLLSTAANTIISLENELRNTRETLYAKEASLRQTRSDLATAEYALSSAKRILGDAEAAKKRVELEIQRAIVLRQSEVYAAKARLALEQRQLDTLKKTVQYLLFEIEAAKLEAIKIATQYDETLAKAKEEERIKIAEEQRKKAEEEARMAEESVGVEREKHEEEMRRAEELAKKAEEEAMQAAKEREQKAIERATTEAEIATTKAKLDLEREELLKLRQELETMARGVAGIPSVPSWIWIALGLGTIGVLGAAIIVTKGKKK